MHPALSPLVAATTRWLTRAYPSGGGALQRALAEGQARQAVTLAAALRYPTDLDAGLVAMTGAGGTGRLDWITGADAPADTGGEDRQGGLLRGEGHEGREEHPDAWRTWVDETVASWAACLLGDPELAAAAGAAVGGAGAPDAHRRLRAPGEHDRRAAALLRHPDLLAPVADLHRAELLDLVAPSPDRRG
ncbi:hypothetical protein [Streptomyces sp. CC77]|uniref:hypothetical protein n=1 Tax=Streptomyces sp. CC77 TaxID=1906739 RepID=UPI0008DD182E|nr:hypothetical protein [Streptomyces sp. CC77]OII65981.1 hypothetical protein BJP39_28670 [Streptomyces sp. CC77]